MITLDRLRYFLAAARFEHVGKAAENLHISPSVISAAIQNLEEDLGCELFIRDKNRIKLSRHGRLLVDRANKIITGIEELSNEVNSESQELTGHYRLGASHFLMQEYLVPAFLKIQKQNPLITAEFVSLDSGVAVAQVAAGLLDSALIFRASYSENLDETVLHMGQFQIAVGINNPILKIHKNKIVDEINKLPAITFRTSTGVNFWENHPAFKSLGIVPRHAFFYDDTQTAVQLMNQTQGWAFLPDKILAKCKHIKKVSLTNELNAPVNISMISNRNHKSDFFIEKLITSIKARI